MITKSSVVKIQNLVLNPKSQPNKLNFEQQKNFYLSMFPVKINDKIFQNKEQTLFWGDFCPKGIFPKNTG